MKIIKYSILCLLLCSCNSNETVIKNMRCEYLTNPICIDSPSPRFTWNYDGKESFIQGKFQLKIATDRENLNNLSNSNTFVWNSNTIQSDKTQTQYDGIHKLQSHTKYYWQLTVWDESGKVKIESPILSFETAKMDQTDWTGQWITDRNDKDCGASPLLKKSFVTTKKIEKARLYISAAAYYRMSINGTKISSTSLNPGYTHYDKRSLYDVYDITNDLKIGKNVLAAALGNGFYNEIAPVGTWDFEKARWRNRARMICELHIQYSDGSKMVINSDDTWQTNEGPYIQNNIYAGDTYDTRLESMEKSNDEPSFEEKAIKVSSPSPLLVSETMPLIEVDSIIRPISMKAFGDSVYVVDFGTNMSGYCTLSICGERGTNVSIQHGELLKDNGRLEMRNLDIYYKRQPGLDFQTDTYLLNGKDNVLEPNFAYHGFRYVEIKADKPITIEKKDVVAKFIHTAVKSVGKFCCSNDTLNKIWKAVNQSYLSNLMSIPTDCPQREKNGWTADAHIAVDLGLLNYDGITFYEKWINDMIDNQTPEGRISGIIPSSGWGYDDWIGPVWDSAIFIIPMALYHYYGDTKGIEKIIPTCTQYLNYLNAREDSNKTVTYGIGDWVFYKTQTPTDFSTTCYYFLDNLYMSQFMKIVGRDGTSYYKKAQELKDLINTKYFDKSKMVYANGSQASQGIALYLGLVPKEYEQRVADNLSNMISANGNHLDFGVLGSKTVLRMLAKYGYADQAYEMATQQEAPSWSNWIKKGYTTPVETWILSPSFRDASTNHVFLGDINAWMYNILAGINYDEKAPGFRHTIIKPYFIKKLNWVEAEYNSTAGLISSKWERKGDSVVLKVRIPVNTTATLDVYGKKIEIGSGSHEFTFENK